MIINVGKLEDLVKWFYEKSDFTYLLLFVAGQENDDAFFSSLFDKKETIDLVSGQNIAVFLHLNSNESVLEVREKSYVSNIFPGQILTSIKQSNELNKFAQHIHISDSRVKNLRSEIVKSSITFTNQIKDYFQLKDDEAPAVILLYKKSPEPVIIKTEGNEDVNMLLNLLKKIKLIEIPQIKNSQKLKKEAKDKLREAQYNSIMKKKELINAIETWKDFLIQLKVPVEVLESILNFENSDKFSSKMGTEGILYNLYEEKFQITFKQAWENEDFRNLCQALVKKRNIYQYTTNHEKNAENYISEIEKKIQRVDEKIEEIEAIKKQIEKMANSFSNRVRIISSIQGFTRFLLLVLSIAKTTNEFLDMKNQLKNSLKKSVPQ